MEKEKKSKTKDETKSKKEIKIPETLEEKQLRFDKRDLRIACERLKKTLINSLDYLKNFASDLPEVKDLEMKIEHMEFSLKEENFTLLENMRNLINDRLEENCIKIKAELEEIKKNKQEKDSSSEEYTLKDDLNSNFITVDGVKMKVVTIQERLNMRTSSKQVRLEDNLSSLLMIIEEIKKEKKSIEIYKNEASKLKDIEDHLIEKGIIQKTPELRLGHNFINERIERSILDKISLLFNEKLEDENVSNEYSDATVKGFIFALGTVRDEVKKLEEEEYKGKQFQDYPYQIDNSFDQISTVTRIMRNYMIHPESGLDLVEKSDADYLVRDKFYTQEIKIMNEGISEYVNLIKKNLLPLVKNKKDEAAKDSFLTGLKFFTSVIYSNLMENSSFFIEAKRCQIKGLYEENIPLADERKKNYRYQYEYIEDFSKLINDIVKVDNEKNMNIFQKFYYRNLFFTRLNENFREMLSSIRKSANRNHNLDEKLCLIREELKRIYPTKHSKIENGILKSGQIEEIIGDLKNPLTHEFKEKNLERNIDYSKIKYLLSQENLLEISTAEGRASKSLDRKKFEVQKEKENRMETKGSIKAGVSRIWSKFAEKNLLDPANIKKGKDLTSEQVKLNVERFLKENLQNENPKIIEDEDYISAKDQIKNNIKNRKTKINIPEEEIEKIVEILTEEVINEVRKTRKEIELEEPKDIYSPVIKKLISRYGYNFEYSPRKSRD